MNYLIQNPSSYQNIIPQKINPFTVQLNYRGDGVDILDNDSGIEFRKTDLPENIRNANEKFRDLTLNLIFQSRSLSFESFEKLTYMIEIELINSRLTLEEKNFFLKETAILKFNSSLKSSNKVYDNGRIKCDFECRWNECMEGKITDAFESAHTWLETAWVIYNMPLDMPIWQVSCIYEAW